MEENIVKQVCKELNINQTELAKELGVTTGAISKWKKEMPKVAEKALELMLINHRQNKQLEILRKFKKMLLKID